MRAFRVDTDHVSGTVSNMQTAAERLGGGKDMLDALTGRLSDHDPDGRIEEFRDRWKDEFGIISDMMGKFKDALTSAADGYNKADQDMHAAWTAPPEGPTEV
jgi:hypothetical protein